MANTQAVCSSFKTELLNGYHAFGASSSIARTASAVDVFKGALYLSSATMNATTTAYTTTGEASLTANNYTAGGVTITNETAPVISGTTACWTPSASLVWTTVTLPTAFNTLLLYNSTQSNRAVAVFTFGDQIVTAGNFTLTMPANVAGTALLQLA